MMCLRDTFFKKIKKNSNLATKHLYKQFRNRIVVKHKESKRNYFHNYFHVNINNMKLLWTGIRSIISMKNSLVNATHKLKDTNGNLITGSTTMANK